jgi:co-chaperonin GroES (HSP10)
VSVATAAKIKLLSEVEDFRATVFKEIGDLSKHKVFGGRVLVAIFFRPEKTKGGIIRPNSNVEEDAYQSKLGLVIQKGASAFVSDSTVDFRGDNVEVGDYVFFRPGDGFPTERNGVPCRVFRDESIMMKVDDPKEWF